MPKIKPTHLLGTTLEGGGQLLRLSIGLASLTSIPLEITHIRGNRSGGGGLKSQHLSAVQWLSHATGATTSGAVKGSKELEFWPHAKGSVPQRVREEVDIGSPGAVGLVVQALLPYLVWAGGEHGGGRVQVRILGGTNVSKSPSLEYVMYVLVPTLRKIGVGGVDVRLEKRGWGLGRIEMGSVVLEVTPMRAGTKLGAFELVGRGKIVKVEAYVLAPKEVLASFEEEIKAKVHPFLGDVEVDMHVEDSRHAKRVYLLLIMVSENGYRLAKDCLWDRKIKNVFSVIGPMVNRVARELKDEYLHGGCVDENMRDQLAVFQALADGRSEIDAGRKSDGPGVAASLHALTTYWVAKQILNVDFDKEGNCTGCGMVAKGLITKDGDVNTVTTGIEKMGT